MEAILNAVGICVYMRDDQGKNEEDGLALALSHLARCEWEGTSAMTGKVEWGKRPLL